jgi:hypothetical protein
MFPATLLFFAPARAFRLFRSPARRPLDVPPTNPTPPTPQTNPTQSEGSTRARFAAAVAAECIGTFLFALIGGAAPLKNAQTAWANGIALAVLTYATANVSGGCGSDSPTPVCAVPRPGWLKQAVLTPGALPSRPFVHHRRPPQPGWWVPKQGSAHRANPADSVA